MPTTTETIESLIDSTPWGFMRPAIYKERNVLLVDTLHGTECVPCDLLGLPDPPSSDDAVAMWNYTDTLYDYLQAGIVDLESVAHSVSGYVCRLSADGYTDCTEWEYCETEADVLRWLKEQAEACEGAV